MVSLSRQNLVNAGRLLVSLSARNLVSAIFFVTCAQFDRQGLLADRIWKSVGCHPIGQSQTAVAHTRGHTFTKGFKIVTFLTKPIRRYSNRSASARHAEAD